MPYIAFSASNDSSKGFFRGLLTLSFKCTILFVLSTHFLPGTTPDWFGLISPSRTIPRRGARIPINSFASRFRRDIGLSELSLSLFVLGLTDNWAPYIDIVPVSKKVFYQCAISGMRP